MSSADYREPTNEELWTQPTMPTPPAPMPGALAPLPPTPPVPAATPAPVPVPASGRSSDKLAFVLALVSLVMAIPLTAIALTQAGISALVLVWAGIVGINVAYNRRR